MILTVTKQKFLYLDSDEFYPIPYWHVCVFVCLCRYACISIGAETEIAFNCYYPSSSSIVSNATALSGSDA
jgi:hypothetical protein